MATYLLVHGAWGGGNGWSGIARRLRLVGHDVHIASLTGLGDKAHLISPGITLSTHIDDVTGLIDHQNLTDIILVGHSYGGMVVSGAAAARTDKIKALVYVDAFLPRDGEALWDIADDAARTHYIDAQRDQPGLIAPFPGSPPHLTRHPLLTLLEPVHYGAPDLALRRRTYIYATKGAPTIFTKFYERVKAESGWRVHAINTGHGVMADDPDGLTTLLLAEAH
ncbi:MAG TPA: alpha/beta fold hydrolase [Chakrabartia sp.]|jgi:pimeloyl-ACP methyl ester carboxylesterase|nr:alpha/beta fold hydrolase [Chakrabartia sp.]